MMTRRRLAIQLDSDAMAQVRDMVAAFVAEHGLDSHERARILIVLEELLTNAMKYGYPNRSQPGSAEVALELESSQLTIEYTDDGAAFDPFGAPAPDLDGPIEERLLGGLGIHIVRSLADGARYGRIDDRNVIQLTRRVAVIERNK
jgi:anti-sigma regulatory factor (Ser/Thr protein kinase)